MFQTSNLHNDATPPSPPSLLHTTLDTVKSAFFAKRKCEGCNTCVECDYIYDYDGNNLKTRPIGLDTVETSVGFKV